MSEEKIIDNGEINDEDLGEVSGGARVIFICNNCKREIEYRHGHVNGEVMCFCKTTYFVEPLAWKVTQKGTDKGVSGLSWKDQSR